MYLKINQLFSNKQEYQNGEEMKLASKSKNTNEKLQNRIVMFFAFFPSIFGLVFPIYESEIKICFFLKINRVIKSGC